MAVSSARPAPRAGVLLLALLLGAVSSCTTNPVTGRRELVLMSPEREAQVGAQAAKQVESEIGLLGDSALNSYVDAIGQRVARHSPRQGVAYRFAVASMPEPNAFALPGGYIYVSRGLLAIANSEAELANVLGHEVAHVAARHSAQRETRALGVGVASILGTVLAGAAGGEQAARSVAEFSQVAGAGLIASYGRDQERQSDDVGQRMAAAAGYDAAAMADFLTTLERETRLRSGGKERRPSFLDSHPMTPERIQSTAERARALERGPGRPIAPGRADFLGRMDGLLVGPDPAEGVFDEERFLHPDLGFALDFPRGWATQNGRSAVAAQAPERNALILLEGQGPSGDPREAAQLWARENRLELADGRRDRIGGLDAYRAVALAQGQQGALGVDATWIAHRRMMVRITGIAPQADFRARRSSFARTAESFRPLSRQERDSIHELRLRVVRARAGESLEALSRRTGNAWSTAETAVANGLSDGARLAAGDPVKIAVRVRYRPQP